MNTTVTFRTDQQLKEQASALFEAMGMNLSAALNIFMRQAVLKQKFPCVIDYEISGSAESTYPACFFEYFGSGAELGFDEEPEDPAAIPEELSL